MTTTMNTEKTMKRLSGITLAIALGLALTNCYNPNPAMIDGGQAQNICVNNGNVVCGGVCVNAQIDPAHCGVCGNACSAGFVCQNGTCGCPGTTTLCNGVCVDTQSTSANCGGCGNACNAGEKCQQSTCVRQCAPGTRACPDGDCVNVLTDVNNCGGCGVVCSFNGGTGQCQNGRCTIACNAPFADCDGNPGNGCETNTNANAFNCGACGTVCSSSNGTGTCSQGQCAIACNPGYGDCDGIAKTGCEVNLNTNLKNCGGCGTVCSPPNGFGVCRDGSCEVANCQLGFRDCDGIAQDGCEVMVSTDPSNCGRCGNPCAINNNVPVCQNGTCLVGKCNAGFADCNGDPLDGCEVDLRNSLTSCGVCGKVCDLGNSLYKCAGGQCAIDVCNGGFENCNNNPADGCETNILKNVNHCGACGNACAPAHAIPKCDTGVCAVQSCLPGWGDCDGDPKNGCEVNLLTDANNCGACLNQGGVMCTWTLNPTCQGGKCVPTCSDGIQNGSETDADCGGRVCGKCANGKGCLDPYGADCISGYCPLNRFTCQAYPTCADKVKNDLESDIDCGGGVCPSCDVGKRCGVHADCSSRSCDMKITHSCLAPACDDGIQNGVETDVDCGGIGCAKCLDPKHCVLDSDCVSQICVGGVCQAPACTDGKKNGTETDKDCGGGSCPACVVGLGCTKDSDCALNPNAPAKCLNKVCILACSAGFADCDKQAAGCETNVVNDPLNCGACTNACQAVNGVATCANSVCGASCNAPYANCDGNVQNGCEVNTQNDTNNCSGCGTLCMAPPNATSTCTVGVCKSQCKAGFGDCDNIAVNGCEKNLNTDVNHCGGCNKPCILFNANPGCANGACTIASCLGSWRDCDSTPGNGCEVNIANDHANCGTCGAVCRNDKVCVSGSCACPAGTIDQNGACVVPMNPPDMGSSGDLGARDMGLGPDLSQAPDMGSGDMLQVPDQGPTCLAFTVTIPKGVGSPCNQGTDCQSGTCNSGSCGGDAATLVTTIQWWGPGNGNLLNEQPVPIGGGQYNSQNIANEVCSATVTYGARWPSQLAGTFPIGAPRGWARILVPFARDVYFSWLPEGVAAWGVTFDGRSTASCMDLKKDNAETDVDCGGGSCQPCGANKACAVNADCQSLQCKLGDAGTGTCQ